MWLNIRTRNCILFYIYFYLKWNSCEWCSTSSPHAVFTCKLTEIHILYVCVYPHLNPLFSSSWHPPTISLLTFLTGTFQSTSTTVKGTIIIVSGWLSLSSCCGAFNGWTSRSFWPIEEIGVRSHLATRITDCVLPLANWHPKDKSFQKYYFCQCVEGVTLYLFFLITNNGMNESFSMPK